MTRYVVILPAEPASLKIGEPFAGNQWPPHVTLVPAFSSAAEPQAIAALLAEALAGQSAPQVTFTATEPFVERGGKASNFVTDGTALIALHQALLQALRQLPDLRLDEADHHDAGYVPHAKLLGAGVPVGIALQPRQILLAALPTPGGNASRHVVWEGQLA